MMKLSSVLLSSVVSCVVVALFAFGSPAAAKTDVKKSETMSADAHEGHDGATCEAGKDCAHEGHSCEHGDGKSCMKDGKACSHEGGKACKEHCDKCDHEHAASKATDEKSEFRQKIEGQLEQVDAQLTELKSKTATATTEAKAGIETRISKLEQRRTEIKADLDKMSETSGAAWTKFKSGLQKAVNELKSGYKDAKNELDKKEAAKK